MKKYKVSVNDIQKKDLTNLSSLMFQLSSKTCKKNKELIKDFSHWQEIMNNNFLIIVRDLQNMSVVGIACLIPHIQPLGRFANLQDVVVDEKYRGNGIGNLILEKVFSLAKENNFDKIELTSSRKVAQDWYIRHGFEKRDTQVFKKKF